MKNLIAVCLLAGLPGMAQELKDVQKHWAASKEFTDAVAAAMPDENYGFKAADAEMSFGEMVVHIAQGNGSYCAAAAGAKSPIAKPAKIDKATAIALLDQSFEFCSTTIAGLQDLNKTAGRGMDVRELLWAGFTHTAHHRAQLEVYLRLKGIKPPDYKF